MTNSDGQAKDYARQGRIFLNQAYEELERDDLRQASEKGWGAASQLVKAYAEAQGLQHDRHYLIDRTVRRLIEDTEDDSLLDYFAAAGLLHTNFYEGEYGPRQVRRSLDQVTQFVTKVEAALNGQNGASPTG